MTGRQLCRVKLSHPRQGDSCAGLNCLIQSLTALPGDLLPLLFCAGRLSDTPTVFGQHLDMLAAFGRHLDIRGPCSVRIPPENAGRVRISPENGKTSGARPNPARQHRRCPNPARERQACRARPNPARTHGETLTARDARRSWRTGTVRLLAYIRFASSPGQRRIFLSACRGRLIPVKGTMGAGVFGRKVRL